MKRISLAQLVDKIQTGKLSPQEASEAFIVRPDPQKPFDFKTYINPENVDVRNLEPLARDAGLLLGGVARQASGGKTRPAKRRAGSVKQIVAEGDSWFRLPNIISVPYTCIDYLQQWGYPVRNLAHWGDTLDEMLMTGEFWPYVDAGQQPLLFSGGGNDVLGNGHLAEFINLFDPDHTKPSDAPYYVRKEFFDSLDRIVLNIEQGLVLRMASRNTTCKIIMHGYDYVIPRPNGPWLGGPLQYQGLDPTFNAGLCRAIIRMMIDTYNLKLAALATAYPDVFVHLDLRGTVKVTEWYDELHGKNVAAQKIAQKFATAIDSLQITPEAQALAKLHAPIAA
jgi:N-acetylmuramoyl-L-alanine amidase